MVCEDWFPHKGNIYLKGKKKIMNELADFVIKSLEDEYQDFDKTMKRTDDHRTFLLNVTRKALENIDLSKVNVENWRTTESFSNIATAYANAIDGVEKKATTQVSMKLKYKDSQRSDNASLAVRDLLEAINTGLNTVDKDTPITLEEQEALVEHRVTIDNLPPIEEWETKTDPNDLTT